MTAFPDAEAVAITVLKNSYPVMSSLPKDPSYPCVVIRRIGGVPANKHHLDFANLQFDVWGNDKAQAHDLAQGVRAAIHAAEGTLLTSPIAAYISGVEDTLGLSWLADPVSNQARYVFAVGLYITVPHVS